MRFLSQTYFGFVVLCSLADKSTPNFHFETAIVCCCCFFFFFFVCITSFIANNDLLKCQRSNVILCEIEQSLYHTVSVYEKGAF